MESQQNQKQTFFEKSTEIDIIDQQNLPKI